MRPGEGASAAQPNQPETAELCAQVLALIPAYALHATDPEESHFVQAGLARCPQAAAALAEYTEMAEQMLLAAPPVAAPPHLARRLESALAAPALAAAPPQTSRRSGRNPIRHFFTPARSLAAAALLLAALLLSNFLWNSRYTELSLAHDALQRQMQEQTTLAAYLRDGQMQRVELAAAAGGLPDSRALVMYQPTAQQALLVAEGFPPLAGDQVYQLWLIQGETRFSGGLFRVDEKGRGLLLIDAPEALEQYDRMGITPEPAGGSPGPTAPPVVAGAF